MTVATETFPPIALATARPGTTWPRVEAWLRLILLWMIPALVSTSLAETWGYSFPKAFLSQVPMWLVWAPATPAILWLAGRFPLERGRWLTSIGPHVVAYATVSLTTLLTAMAACRIAGIPPKMPMTLVEELWHFYTYYAELNAVTYGGIVLFGRALETRLAQAQLSALKSQVQPHFLFNSLHAIGVMVRKSDQKGAVEMLTGLSDLLRLTLQNAGAQVVPLRDELDFAQRYLAVERTRFQDKLTVRIEAAPETLDAAFPNLALQPIVENAVRHGLEPKPGPGTIAIETARRDDRLVVIVRDDGPGPSVPCTNPGSGIGLANVRARLEQLHPGAHRFTMEPAPGGGTVVTLEVPWRRSAP